MRTQFSAASTCCGGDEVASPKPASSGYWDLGRVHRAQRAAGVLELLPNTEMFLHNSLRHGMDVHRGLALTAT
jgi:hypothetical protein